MSSPFLAKAPVQLSEIPTRPPEGLSKKFIVKETKVMARRIGELQEILQANGKQNLLIVFQGMDSSGKDGATRSTFRYCSPSGVNAYGFKKPTDEEFAHDFLWRVHKQAPAKGEIKVFIRSHYEDVLIQRVHNWIDEKHVQQRIKAINAFEELLTFDNNTTVLKFYMHLSHARQGEKLQERKEEEDKFYKHNPGDWEERKHWKKYRACYEDVINKASIPWHIIPVDARWYRNYCIAKTVLDTLEGFDLQWPPLREE